jgi:hypothetical protein
MIGSMSAAAFRFGDLADHMRPLNSTIDNKKITSSPRVSSTTVDMSHGDGI